MPITNMILSFDTYIGFCVASTTRRSLTRQKINSSVTYRCLNISFENDIVNLHFEMSSGTRWPRLLLSEHVKPLDPFSLVSGIKNSLMYNDTFIACCNG